MAMVTSCRSRSTLHSYSILTYESPPEVDGQQLMVNGTSPSGSLVCIHRTANGQTGQSSCVLNRFW